MTQLGQIMGDLAADLRQVLTTCSSECVVRLILESGRLSRERRGEAYVEQIVRISSPPWPPLLGMSAACLQCDCKWPESRCRFLAGPILHFLAIGVQGRMTRLRLYVGLASWCRMESEVRGLRENPRTLKPSGRARVIESSIPPAPCQ